MVDGKEITVLITSAGRRAQLMRCIRECEPLLRRKIAVLAADAEPQYSAACSLADRAYKVPRCATPEYIPRLLQICNDERVQLLIPTIDPELEIISRHRSEFASAGVDVAISDPRVVALAGDKYETSRALAEAGISTPRTLLARDFAADPERLLWPLIFKPRKGSSSVGIRRPQTRSEAIDIASACPDLVVQELWQGKEYTVNVFFDKAGQLRCAVPHLRIETRGGEVSKGRTEHVPILQQAARAMANCLAGARGALCFQAIVTDSGDYSIFEINARFGGGYPLAHQAGANFLKWLLEERISMPCTAADVWIPGVLMLRYDSAVFVDGSSIGGTAGGVS